MNESCSNIYQIARNYAGLTQGEAIVHLHICLRTLQAYESSSKKKIAEDNVLRKMIETYQTPWLAYQHARYASNVVAEYLPDLDLTDIAKSVLKFQKEVGDLKKINPDMIDIASDGVIEEHEEERWIKVEKEVSEVASASLRLLFSKQFVSDVKV